MRRSFRTPSIAIPIPGVLPRAGMRCPVGAPQSIIDRLIPGRRGIPMNHRRPHPGSAGHSNGIIDVLVPGWGGSRIRNCPNGATHTSPGQRPGIHIASFARSDGTLHITPSPTDSGPPMRRSFRTPSTPIPYPGFHPGLVCRAPLGHPNESSTYLSRVGGALSRDDYPVARPRSQGVKAGMGSPKRAANLEPSNVVSGARGAPE